MVKRKLNRFYPNFMEKKELCRTLDKLGAVESDKDSSVNIVDMPTDGVVDGSTELSFPSEFPAGELPDNQNDTMEGLYNRPRQAKMHGDLLRKNAEMGQDLTTLVTEQEKGKTRQKDTQHGMWSDSYSNDNQFEDADLKLGENDCEGSLEDAVYPPYSNGNGPIESRYEDTNKNKHDIILHASEHVESDSEKQLWICVDLDGTILSKPDEYQDEQGNQLFGDPLPGAADALREMVDGGARVSIYTARQYFTNNEQSEGDLAFDVENFLLENDILYTDIYIGKKPPAHFFVDDRTIPPFEGDWNLVLDTVRDRLNKNARRKIVARAQGGEKRTYEVEGHPDVIKRLDLMLEAMGKMGDWGNSRGIVLSMDGDGPEFLYVEGTEYKLDGESFDKELNGNDVHVYSLKSVDEIDKEANDPIKDTVDYQGIKIDIEWPAGSIRSYEGSDTYVSHMKVDYGYARGIEGNDGEELDIYLVDRESSSPVAYIIEQLDDGGNYDEDKIILGANSEGEAANIYLQHMPGYMLGDIREVPIERLVNALYGEPEDRRGEEDLVPSEEKLDKKTAFKIFAHYGDLAIRALDQLGPNLELAKLIFNVVDVKLDYVPMIDALSKAMIADSMNDNSLEKQIESLMPEDTRPQLQFPDYSPEEIQSVEKAVGPSGTQVIQAMLKNNTKTWPDDDIFDNEYTDGTEDRENRDIPRPPENKKATYRSAELGKHKR